MTIFMIILLTITFIFGVIRLLTFTKLFKVHLTGLIMVLIPYDGEDFKFLNYLDWLIFYFSLCFQAWFWIFQDINF
jgi:hypothetical protein